MKTTTATIFFPMGCSSFTAQDYCLARFDNSAIAYTSDFAMYATVRIGPAPGWRIENGIYQTLPMRYRLAGEFNAGERGYFEMADGVNEFQAEALAAKYLANPRYKSVEVIVDQKRSGRWHRLRRAPIIEVFPNLRRQEAA
ncbi:MAG: hypothetical protein JWM16_569 [Verrucomicrobiales bacterium]|nr:hypothetical protein [Verrucomicrobiales bacterium]